MTRPLTSTLSAKGQTTIPVSVRRSLQIEPGDVIRYDVEDGAVRIRKTSPLDIEWAGAVEATLTEWSDEEDDDL
jgi:AbrB family looped-hinge helix DNA binding protein